MKTQKSISMENLEWEKTFQEARHKSMTLSERIEQLIILGRVKEREIIEREERTKKKEMLDIAKHS